MIYLLNSEFHAKALFSSKYLSKKCFKDSFMLWRSVFYNIQFDIQNFLNNWARKILNTVFCFGGLRSMLFSSTFGYVISSIIELEKFQRQFYVMEVCILIIQFDIWFCNFLNFWASCSNDRPSVTGRTFKNWKDPWL